MGVSSPHVDRIIRYLEEFGPEFFHLTQLTRISPKDYRAIAPHVTKDGLRFGDEVIALIPENTEKVSSAVAALRQRPGSKGDAAREDRFAALEKRFEDLIARADAIADSLEADQKESLDALLTRLCVTLLAAGV